MDTQTLLAGLEFSRMRLLGILDAIEKSGQDPTKVLGWRPGPGRAHIAWQAMHCAATHDIYLNKGIHQGTPKDTDLVAGYSGGTTPSDVNIPSFVVIRQKLAATYEPFKKFTAEQTTESLAKQIPAGAGKTRSIAEAILLMTWHESHHQGQIHLTWNLYKEAHGLPHK